MPEELETDSQDQSPVFDVDAARKAGANDDQIFDYLTKKHTGFDANAALKAGATKQHVIDYLSKKSAGPIPQSQLDAARKQDATYGENPQAAPKPPETGLLAHAWDWANRGLISKDDLVGAISGMPPGELDKQLAPYEGETPTHAALREFVRGAIQDTGKTASSFTSPLALGTMAAGAAAKLPGAAATAGKALSGAASVGFGAAGAKDALTPKQPGESDADYSQRILQGAAQVASGAHGAIEAGIPGAAETVGNRGREWFNARMAARAAKTDAAAANTFTPAEQARNTLINTALGGKATAQEFGPDTHAVVDKVLAQVDKDTPGGKQSIAKANGADKQSIQRLADALHNSGAKTYEFTKSNYVDQVGGEPISIEQIAPNLESIVANKSFQVAQPEVAGMITKVLKTGTIPAADAFWLKARLNDIADPAFGKEIGENAANNAEIAKKASQYLQRNIADVIDDNLGEGQGAEYRKADQLQGQTAFLRNRAIDAASDAAVTNPEPARPSNLRRGLTAGVGGATGAGIGGSIAGYPGAAAGAALGGALGKAVGDLLPGKLEHPDFTAADALRKIELPEAPRPEVPAEVAANLRPSSPAVAAQGASSPPGTNVVIPPVPQPTNINPNLAGMTFPPGPNAAVPGVGQTIQPMLDSRMTTPIGGVLRPTPTPAIPLRPPVASAPPVFGESGLPNPQQLAATALASNPAPAPATPNPITLPAVPQQVFGFKDAMARYDNGDRFVHDGKVFIKKSPTKAVLASDQSPEPEEDEDEE